MAVLAGKTLGDAVGLGACIQLRLDFLVIGMQDSDELLSLLLAVSPLTVRLCTVAYSSGVVGRWVTSVRRCGEAGTGDLRRYWTCECWESEEKYGKSRGALHGELHLEFVCLKGLRRN